MEIQLWGWRLQMERLDKLGGDYALFSDDQVNAHNALSRREAVLHIRGMCRGEPGAGAACASL